MLYKGIITCEEHGEFEWQIAEGLKNQIIIGKDLICKNVKSYDKKNQCIKSYCPVCAKTIEINYNFEKNEVVNNG